MIADLSKDGAILQQAREAAQQVLEDDPELQDTKNSVIRNHIESLRKDETNWSRIS
jgi:ATP-dependent DNA helicase RecG